MMGSNSVFTTLGASNHTKEEREKDDYYATTPDAAHGLLGLETFTGRIWECACGAGHLSEVFKKEYSVISSDRIDRGYGTPRVNFLSEKNTFFDGNIITNPPYKLAQEFIKKALSIVPEGKKVCMFLKVQFLEGKKRKKLFTEYPPIRVWVSSSRLLCAKNAEFEKMKAGGGSAVAYAWFVWEKGYKGRTELGWFN